FGGGFGVEAEFFGFVIEGQIVEVFLVDGPFQLVAQIFDERRERFNFAQLFTVHIRPVVSQLNSSHARSTGLTPTGACTLRRYPFLICFSILPRISPRVFPGVDAWRGVWGVERMKSAI